MVTLRCILYKIRNFLGKQKSKETQVHELFITMCKLKLLSRRTDVDPLISSQYYAAEADSDEEIEVIFSAMHSINYTAMYISNTKDHTLKQFKFKTLVFRELGKIL